MPGGACCKLRTASSIQASPYTACKLPTQRSWSREAVNEWKSTHSAGGFVGSDGAGASPALRKGSNSDSIVPYVTVACPIAAIDQMINAMAKPRFTPIRSIMPPQARNISA